MWNCWEKKISFGDIPNSSSIDILMPFAIFDYMVAHVDNVIRVTKTITWLLLSRLQGNKAHRNPPEPSEACLRNLHQHAPELFGTLRNFPNPASGTYTNTLRNSPEPSGTFQDLPEPTLRNLPEPTSGTYASMPSGTFRNLPEPASGTYTSTHRNSPEPSGTFRNLPPEPAPATRTGTHRSLSGLKTPLAYAVGEKKKIQKTFTKKVIYKKTFSVGSLGIALPALSAKSSHFLGFLWARELLPTENPLRTSHLWISNQASWNESMKFALALIWQPETQFCSFNSRFETSDVFHIAVSCCGRLSPSHNMQEERLAGV